jgi:D-glycero-D-manno-heptose 1,7-bisphosphate phosphatase
MLQSGNPGNRMRAAVFLDRDGVLNRSIIRAGKSYPPTSLDEFQILPGVVDACRALKQAGYVLVVVTNQPDVARGSQSRQVIEAMNSKLMTEVVIDEIKVCYHDDSDRCFCRKPQPGMLLEAARDWNIELSRSFMIGDRGKDIQAGKRAGCMTILVEGCQSESIETKPDHVFVGLHEAAGWILQCQHAYEARTK